MFTEQVPALTRMAGQLLEGAASGAVGQAQVAVARPARHQHLLRRRVVQEDQVAHRPVVHVQLHLRTQSALLRAEGHQPERLVVGAAGQQVAGVVEGAAVDRATVLFGPQKADLGRQRQLLHTEIGLGTKDVHYITLNLSIAFLTVIFSIRF